MAHNRIKHLGRRGLALFLTLVMVTSLLQISAFAYTNQVMDGYYTVDANGQAALETTGATSVTEDGYTLSKTIRQTGENAFDITLQVETSQTITTAHAKAATVLVIDLSNSMNNPLSDKETRIAAAKEVAKQFLASYAGKDAGAEQYLSIVWFGTYSGVDLDWINVAGGAGQNSYDRAFNYLDNLTAPHDDYYSGGTNLDAGLETAKNQLAIRKDIVEQKNVVLLTDGKPTYGKPQLLSGQHGDQRRGGAHQRACRGARPDEGHLGPEGSQRRERISGSCQSGDQRL